MIKKSVMCILAGLAVMGNLSLAVGAEDISHAGLFIFESTADEIQYNMYEGDEGDYYYLYGTDDVAFDFHHAMPNYVLDYSKAADAVYASDMLKFTDCYIVPTLNSDNQFVAFTEFKQIPDLEYADEVLQQYSEPEYKKVYDELKRKYTEREGEWEIVGVFQGGDTEDFYSFITSKDNDILTYRQSYLVSDENGYNILLVSDDNELYFSFDKLITQSMEYSFDEDNGAFMDGSELIAIAVEEYEDYENLPADQAGSSDDNFDLDDVDVIIEEIYYEYQNTDDFNDNDIETDTVYTSNPKTGSAVSYYAAVTVISSLVCIGTCKKHKK